MMRRPAVTGQLAAIMLCASGSGQALQFNPQFLAGQSAQADMSDFYQHSSLPDGQYDLDIYVNDAWKGRYPVRLAAERLTIPADLQDSLGIRSLESKDDRIELHQLVRSGKIRLDTGELALHLQVPQAWLNQGERDYVSPEGWDRGEPGLVTSYNASFYQSTDKETHTRTQSMYAQFASSLNLLGWQLRDNSSFSRQSGRVHWENNSRYLERGLGRLGARVKMGDSYTNSDMFDSIKFRGAEIATDIRMLPDSQQGFAPVVHGVAQTNALVKIYQNGVVIYQNNVPPGPFNIDNILPTGSGGDLNVEVNEADGRISRFIVPFSSVPNMLKEGVSKFSVNVGQARVADTRYHPNFVQGTWQYGFNNTFTGYGGSIVSEDYLAMLGGVGINLSVGAVSFDVSQSRFNLPGGERRQGQSYKLAYSRFFPTSRTNFSLAAYRYSTAGYLTLNDAIMLHDAARGDHVDTWNRFQAKNTFNINLNQSLSEGLGSFFISGTLRDYWASQRASRDYQIGYANNWGRVNYSLALNRTRDSRGSEENRYTLTLSLPLSVFDNPAYVTASAAAVGHHYSDSNVGIGGSAGESGRLNYNVSVADQRDGATAGNASLNYRASASTLNGSWGESRLYRQIGLGASGSLAFTRQGVLMSNQQGDTFAVVEAPGLNGAVVNSDSSVTTNGSGKALIASLAPYRSNRIMLDARDKDSAQLLNNMRVVAPYSGAIVHLNYPTDTRRSYLIRARRPGGEPLPFGARVIAPDGESMGYVGQGSTLYVRAATLPERLEVVIDSAAGRRCIVKMPGGEPSSSAVMCNEERE